ncbi:MAG: DegV family protein [Gaiellales bacterium]|nr:DegV family protein [Gaiellales bacterium]
MILNRQNTAVIVDSTADLPDYLAMDPNLTIVPLMVHIGGETYLDWVELKPEAFYEKLSVVEQLPRTSQPAVGVFKQLYERLRGHYEHIYSIHLSSEFSGTYSSACMAQQSVSGVTVVDSQLATGGIALLVDRVMERLSAGIAKEDLDAYLSRYVADRGFYFIPQTLDYLAKGGRIGRAAHLVGTLLNITPVLTIKDGMADAYKRVRGMRQALRAMQKAVLSHTSSGRPVYMSLMHAVNLPLLERLREAMQLIPDRHIEIRLTTTVGPVIGTYCGPGAVGICFIQE